MLYPRFTLVPHQGRIISHVPLPENFRELVPGFYSQGRRKRIEEYVEDKNEFKEFWNRMALDSGKMICDIEKIKRKIILEEN